MVMTSQAPQCDAREEEPLLATNDTAAASINVDGARWQQSTVLPGMKWLDRAMSARFSTDRDLDGLPLDSLIHDAFKIRGAETKLLELFAAGELNGTVHTCGAPADRPKAFQSAHHHRGYHHGDDRRSHDGGERERRRRGKLCPNESHVDPSALGDGSRAQIMSVSAMIGHDIVVGTQISGEKDREQFLADADETHAYVPSALLFERLGKADRNRSHAALNSIRVEPRGPEVLAAAISARRTACPPHHLGDQAFKIAGHGSGANARRSSASESRRQRRPARKAGRDMPGICGTLRECLPAQATS